MSDRGPVDGDLASFLRCCTVSRLWAEQDEGPYHRDTRPVRRDIVEDCEGVELQLGIRLINNDGTPVPGAVVEIWQCDALGRYSGFPPPESSGAGALPATEVLSDQTFLRGGQATDAAGMVEFRTIYPGWYPGRTVHIHLMVAATGGRLTSQLYFSDTVTDHVLARTPYAERPGRDTTNSTDAIFPTDDAPVVDIVPAGDGYRAAISLVLPGPTEVR